MFGGFNCTIKIYNRCVPWCRPPPIHPSLLGNAVVGPERDRVEAVSSQQADPQVLIRAPRSHRTAVVYSRSLSNRTSLAVKQLCPRISLRRKNYCGVSSRSPPTAGKQYLCVWHMCCKGERERGSGDLTEPMRNLLARRFPGVSNASHG